MAARAKGATSSFHPAVKEWFAETFPGPTRAQVLGWPEIAAGRSCLILAPTGSGKTLAAFLFAIDRLLFGPPPADPARRCRVLYLSPLRALAVDVERNLRVPLRGIAAVAARRGEACREVEIALRTGDTPAAERARVKRRPPDILITTPESLFLLLTSQARALLAGVEAVIVDEIHTMVSTKRGAHLALSLERLEERTGRPLQRIGLSATQRPLEVVARYLGGGEAGRAFRPRPVTIVDAGRRRPLRVVVEVPVEDMTRTVPVVEGRPETGDGAGARSLWPAIHPRLVELIRGHRTTLVFVNSRRLAERLAGALNDDAGEELARAHHGSLAREQRIQLEEQLKAGQLPALVATSSLELGIDMGAIDLVVQIETPPSVASGLQRLGRAGHQADGVSEGVIFPKFRGDLLATAAVVRAMVEGEVEETRIPRNPLDVLAQQVVAICAVDDRTVDDLFALVRRAAPFEHLPRAQLEGVLDMLSGRYPSDEFAELRPRLTWDRRQGTVRAREGAARLAIANAGTIPDRGLYGVFLADGDGESPTGSRRPSRRVGELDEEMVFESRPGEVFVLGASSWRIVEIGRDRVLVVPAPGEPGRMPFWHGDRPPRPMELGRAVGRLTRRLGGAEPQEAEALLTGDHALQPQAARNLVQYLADQKAATGALPDDVTLVVERSRDQIGDWRVCVLSPWGGRVHAPWAMVLGAQLRARGVEAQTVWSDDGLVVRTPDRDSPLDTSWLLPDPDTLEDALVAELGGTALFASRFREAAGRALLLPRRRPGQRAPLWMQRRRAADLLAVAGRYGSFPIVLETYRECLQDVFDVPALLDLAKRLRSRELRVVTADTEAPSPFAASLLFGYVANYIYEGDAPLAERRAQALTVDQAQLRELLGEAELRELLSPEALDEIETALQGLDPARRAASPDRVHDLLLRLGDLTLDELRARAAPPGDDALARDETLRAWLVRLEAEQRVIRVPIAGEPRLLAAEDAGKVRDALGGALPPGLPDAFLEPRPFALRDLAARYARTRGPFRAADFAARYGIVETAAEAALAELAARGRVLEGEFRPGGHGREWCDAEVLARLRNRSLARLRRQVEPAPAAALARLMLDWQGVAARAAEPPRGGPDALLDVVAQLQGAVFPASALEKDVLGARLPGYRPGDLDLVCAAGEVVWKGYGPLGERDGRLALFLADDLRLLETPPTAVPDGTLHEAIRAHLSHHGASFFADIHAAVGGLAREVVNALWDLAWAGEASTDTPAALRAVLRPPASHPHARPVRAAFRSRRQAPPAAAGRWSLLSPKDASPSGTPTRRLKALAEQLLARHGVLTRPAAMAEGVPGGYAGLHPVLQALEEAGRVRRGYFVAGLGGSQFALPGALDRLRAVRETARDPGADLLPAAVLAATDPANPFGSTLAWPDGSRATRSSGTHVVIVDGLLAAVLTRGGGEVHTRLPEDEPRRTDVARAAADALGRWAARTGRFNLGFASGAPELAPFLRAARFLPHGPGYRFMGPAAPVAPDEAPPADEAPDQGS